MFDLTNDITRQDISNVVGHLQQHSGNKSRQYGNSLKRQSNDQQIRTHKLLKRTQGAILEELKKLNEKPKTRPPCPSCGDPCNVGFATCPRCNASLVWLAGQPCLEHVYEKQKARREKDGKRRLKERQAAAKAEAETKARTRQLQTAKREKKEREEREAREAKEAQGTARAKLKARLQERMIKETPRTLGRDDVLLEALCCMIVVDGPVSEKEQEKLFKIAGRLESSYSSDQIAKLVSSAATRSRMKGGVAKQLESFFGNLQVVALSTEDKKALLADLLVLSEVDGGPGKHQTQLLNRLMDAFFPEAPNDTLENKPNANELAAERVHSLESNSNATPHVFTTLLKSFCCMMAADGKVVADEKKAAKTILNRLNCPLTHDEIAHVVQEFRAQVASQGIELVLQHTLSEIRHFLRNKSSKKSFRKLLGEIASADGDVTEDEKQVARRMLQAMSG